MIECSAKLSELLELKEKDEEAYSRQILWAFESFTKHWDRETSFEEARKARENIRNQNAR